MKRKETIVDYNNTAQDNFLNSLITEGDSVAIFLINGIKLTGTLVYSTPDALFLKNGNTQLIYKSKISTVMRISEHHLPLLSNIPKRKK